MNQNGMYNMNINQQRKEDNAQTKDYISVHGKSFSRQNRQEINAKFRELKRRQEQVQ